MRRVTRPSNNILGCWNAYVADGASREERQERLEEAPERHRDQVKSHVETVFQVRSAAKRRKARAALHKAAR